MSDAGGAAHGIRNAWSRGQLVRVTRDHSTREVGDILTIADDDPYADWPWVRYFGCVNVTFPRDCLEAVASTK